MRAVFHDNLPPVPAVLSQFTQSTHRRQRAQAAFAEKEIEYERVLHRNRFLQRSVHNQLLLGQHGDLVRQRHQRVQVVRYHHYRQVEFLMQRLDQFDEAFAAVRVQPGGRFVQKHELGLQHQSPRKCNAFDHAAGEVGRHLRGVLALDVDHIELEHHHVADEILVERAQLAQRQGDIVEYRQRAVERALLEQHAPALADLVQQLRIRPLQRDAEHLDRSARRLLQAQYLAHQRGLAAARAAHQRHHLARHHREIQVLVHHVIAKLRPQAGDFDHRGHDREMPTSEKITAKMASAMITAVIEVTTELVVPMPRLSVLGCTRRPKWQAMRAMSAPNTTPLPIASQRLTVGTAPGRPMKNECTLIPSCVLAASAPPIRAMPEVHRINSGIAIASATILGRIRRTVCGMPITDSASSSSVTRITPSCAVMAEPERPATSTAAITGPSSRMMPIPSKLMMNILSPNAFNYSAE